MEVSVTVYTGGINTPDPDARSDENDLRAISVQIIGRLQFNETGKDIEQEFIFMVDKLLRMLSIGEDQFEEKSISARTSEHIPDFIFANIIGVEYPGAGS